MPPRKYNPTRAACMFCECEPCECGGPLRSGPKKVDLTAVLGKQIATTATKPVKVEPAPHVESAVAEVPVQPPRHSPGKLTSAKQQQSSMPTRSGLAKVNREVIEEETWHDDSIDEGHIVTAEEATMILFLSGMVSIESMIEHKDKLGLSESEANKLIWKIARGKGD